MTGEQQKTARLDRYHALAVKENLTPSEMVQLKVLRKEFFPRVRPHRYRPTGD